MVLQTAHFLAFRSEYEFTADGILYSDMRGVATTQQFKDKIRESMIQANLIDEKDEIGNYLKKENQSLHIFDNVESIINNKGEFDWNIVNLLKVYENMRIIVISRNELKYDDMESVEDLLLVKQLAPLTDEESVDLIQSNCERQIMEDLAEHNNDNFQMAAAETKKKKGDPLANNRPNKI